MTPPLILTRDMALNPAEFDLLVMRERNKRKLLEKAVEQSKRRRAAQYRRFARKERITE